MSIFSLRSFLSLALCLPVALPAQAQDTFVINLRGAEISVLAEQVSEITGRTLVLDPNLSGDVSVVSAEPLDEDGVWALFQSILQVRGFVAVQSGTAWQVVPEARARTISGSTTNADAGSQDFVTTMLRLDRLPSAEAVRVLAPLVADSGYIEAIADPNAVLITDTRANVDRISAIARAFDSDENVRAEVIRFANADAVAVGAAIVEVLGEAGTGARLSVNASTNQLLVRGSPDDIQEIRDLARSMDVAERQSPQVAISTQVFRMQFGDAAVVAEILRGTLGDAVELSNPVAADQGALEQVLINLIANACDACAGVAEPKVRVRTRFVSGLVFNTIRFGKATRLPIEITVTDGGPGIDPALRDHVFEPFVSSKPHGQGLGLALVRKLLRDMGGRISHERDERAGETHFRINLPIAAG